MNSDEVVFSALRSSGIPGTKAAWPLGKAPKLPWYVYYQDRGGEVFADNANYERLTPYTAELYMKDIDQGVISRFEEALGKLSPYTSNETWVSSENCFMRTYEFTFYPDYRKESE